MLVDRWDNLPGSSLILLACGIVAVGCSGSGAAVDASPQSAVVAVMNAYDANKDGAIDADEQKRFTAFAAAGATLDRDGNKSISTEELTGYFELIFGTAGTLTEFVCTVFLDGRPLDGAEVTLRSVDFLPEFPTAKGTTDAQGIARPTVPKEEIAAEYRHLALVTSGLYAVEITASGKQLPARYNTATELGCLVTPASRSGASARFDLTSK